jgi:hypothetical protein
MTVTCVEGLQELMESRVRVVGTRQGFEELGSF